MQAEPETQMRSSRRVLTLAACGALLWSGWAAARADVQARATMPIEAIRPAEPPVRLVASSPTTAPTSQADVLDSVRRALGEGRLHEGLEALRTHLNRCPDDFNAHLLLARAWTVARRFDQAIEAARRAAELRPGEPEPRLVLGDLLRLAEQPAQAIGQYRAATLVPDARQDNPAVTLAWQRLGDVLADEGYMLAAAQAFGEFDRRIFDQYPRHREESRVASLVAHRPRGLLARRLHLLRQIDRADLVLATAREAARRWPDDPVVQGELGWALLEAGQPDQAAELARSHRSRPERWYIFVPIELRSAAARHRLDAWVAELQRNLADDQNTALALQAARELLRDGHGPAASPLLASLAARTPDDVDLLALRFEALLASGKTQAALAALAAYADAHRRTAWLPVGMMVEQLRTTGRQQLDAAAPAKPGFGSRFARAVAWLSLGRIDKAQKLLTRLSQQEPGFVPARTAVAQVALLDGDWPRARALAEALLKQQQIPAAYWLLGRALDGLDLSDQAEQHLRRAALADRGTAAYALDLARHHARLGNTRSAQRYYQQALRADPTLGRALEELIDSYVRAGKLELAAAAVEQADPRVVPLDAMRRARLRLRFLRPPFSDDHLAVLADMGRRFKQDRDTVKLLAMGLFYRGRYDEAVRQIKQLGPLRASERYPLTMLLANAHAQQADYDTALELLEKLRTRYPNRREVLRNCARAAMATVQMARARQVLTHLIELERQAHDDAAAARRTAARAELLRTWLLVGNTDEALAQLDRWQTAGVDPDWVRQTRIGVLASTDRTGPLRRALEEALQTAPSDDVRQQWIRLARQHELYDLAEQTLRHWIETADEMTRARWTAELVDVYIAAGRPEAAIKLAEAFKGGFRDDVLRRLWIARARIAAGQTTAGLAEFDAMLKDRLVPQELRPTLWRTSVLALSDADLPDEALARARTWIQAADDAQQQDDARDLIIRLSLELGHPQIALREARTWLDQLETADPQRRYRALRLYGVALQAAGRDREYARVLAEARFYAPDDVGIANDLGYTWIDHGLHPQQAARLILRAVAAEPLNPAFIDSLGWLYYRTGRFEQAYVQLARAVQFVEGRDPVVYDHLADCAWRLGRTDAAREAWNQALQRIADEKDPLRRRSYAAVEQQIRAKLEALSARRDPAVAPTLEEQHATQAARIRD